MGVNNWHSSYNLRRGIIHRLPVRKCTFVMCIVITASLVFMNISEHVRSRIKQRTATPSDYLLNDYKLTSEMPKTIEIEEIHAKRYDQMINACKGREREYRGHYTRGRMQRNILVDVKNSFVYCAVEKIGNTFWRRLFMDTRCPS